MADMVVAEIRRRHAERPTPGTAVKRGRNTEFATLLPDRVVVVGTVETDHVVPHGEVGGIGPFFGDLGDGAVDHAVQHHGLETQFADGVLEFGDGFLRVVHRNHCRWGDAVFERFEEFRLVDVERPARRDARFGVVDPG